MWAWIHRLIPYGCPPDLANRDILLVVAHPDDEVMFFGPTLALLTTPWLNNTLSVLCLTTGDADGLGHVRRLELEASLKQFAVPSSRVTVIDSPSLPDSQTVEWDLPEVESIVSDALKSSMASVLITFDDEGVSHHPNHKALSQAASSFTGTIVTRRFPSIDSDNHHTPPPMKEPLQVWKLNSVSLVRKYTMLFDALYTYYLQDTVHAILYQLQSMVPDHLIAKYNALLGRLPFGLSIPTVSAPPDPLDHFVVVSRRPQYKYVKDTMTRAHYSQMVWFRHLWLLFSRYVVVNDLFRDVPVAR